MADLVVKVAPSVMTALEEASECELIAELARRNEALLVALLRRPALRTGTEEPVSLVWRGGFTTCFGLAHRMICRLRELIRPSPDEGGDG